MPVFHYVARDEQGKLVDETLAYETESALRSHLRKNNLYVVQLAERRHVGLEIDFQRSVGLKDLIVMTRQLRTMVKAGMPLVMALDALIGQSTNSRLAKVLAEVGRSVGHGASLGNTLSQYPHVFPTLLVTLIRSGEEGGRLPEVLQEASRQLEMQMEVRQKLISALIYPAFMLLATGGTLVAMLTWIVPVFAHIYKELHADLPPITLLLISISNLLIHQGWILIVLLIAGWTAFRRYYRTPKGRLRVDGWKLRIPVFGALFLKSASANMTGSLAGLLESGLPLLQAMQTVSQVCGNEVIAEAVLTVAQTVALGRRLSDEMEKTGHFPIMVVRMVAIAEDVGTLPEVLREISSSYVEEVEYTIRRIVGLIEPIMVLTIGGILGFVLVALYYPIFNLGNVFLNGA